MKVIDNNGLTEFLLDVMENSLARKSFQREALLFGLKGLMEYSNEELLKGLEDWGETEAAVEYGFVKRCPKSER